MNSFKKIKTALVSVYHKDGLELIIKELNNLEINIYATGGTQDFIKNLGVKVIPIEEITSYPSILGGRVKTLHPKIFGGILSRRENSSDVLQLEEYNIPEIDLVIVDLYPFEKTLESETDEATIIEKIDIGGISLIRAAAKNYKDVLIVPCREDYSLLLNILQMQKGSSSLEDRRLLATKAFNISSHYDTTIFKYFNHSENEKVFKQSIKTSKILRYGENPHQKGTFYGRIEDLFEQLNGKELSYNNLLDIDAAIALIKEFQETTFAILKHNNACGVSSNNNAVEAYKLALEGDPVSAFGGIIITNATIDTELANEINNLFFEILIAPVYTPEALEILKQKKNRILLLQKIFELPSKIFRTILNGVIEQERDSNTEEINDLKQVTKQIPSDKEKDDLLFANKIVKHNKSNAITLAKSKQLLGSGVGQTSRIDALKQSISKAKTLGLNLQGAVMASDAFFPFPDCVEIAHAAGITAIIQPGGSIKDKDSIDFCNKNNISMVFTGVRHFKH